MKPFTASERRGVLVVAFLSLLVIGAGILVGYCDRPDPQSFEPAIEVLMEGDTITPTKETKKDNKKKKSKEEGKNKKSKKTKTTKENKKYGRRSPIDETV